MLTCSAGEFDQKYEEYYDFMTAEPFGSAVENTQKLWKQVYDEKIAPKLG